MKKKSKAFALVETLIVSTIIASILIYMFVQFNRLEDNYSESFKYNDVDDLYKLDSIKGYITSLPTDLKSSIKNSINNDTLINISKNNDSYTNIEYIDNQQNLLENLNVKSLIITSADVSKINKESLSASVKKMLKKIKNKSDNYRMIAEFNNDSIATITFSMEVL